MADAQLWNFTTGRFDTLKAKWEPPVEELLAYLPGGGADPMVKALVAANYALDKDPFDAVQSTLEVLLMQTHQDQPGR
jgi:hypothetical protein